MDLSPGHSSYCRCRRGCWCHYHHHHHHCFCCCCRSRTPETLTASERSSDDRWLCVASGEARAGRRTVAAEAYPRRGERERVSSHSPLTGHHVHYVIWFIRGQFAYVVLDVGVIYKVIRGGSLKNSVYIITNIVVETEVTYSWT